LFRLETADTHHDIKSTCRATKAIALCWSLAFWEQSPVKASESRREPFSCYLLDGVTAKEIARDGSELAGFFQAFKNRVHRKREPHTANSSFRVGCWALGPNCPSALAADIRLRDFERHKPPRLSYSEHS
jgi:hypothetical protein